MGQSWTPLADIESPRDLGREDVRALAHVWREHRLRESNSPTCRLFEEKLKREWAVETGLIEGIYFLRRVTVRLLVEGGIRSALIPSMDTDSPELVAAMIRDHKDAIDSLYDSAQVQQPLSTSYIRQLHALMTRHQETVEGVDSLRRRVTAPLLKGAYKKRPNNPMRPADGSIHEYCPPEHVAAEMDRLIELHLQHQKMDVAPEVEAAWLHHRFTQIHPFQDANGRVARALATLVLIKAGWLPLVVQSDEKPEYVRALEDADMGDLQSLVNYFCRLQRKAFVRALGAAQEAEEVKTVADAIQSVRRHLEKRRDSSVQEWETTRLVAKTLRKCAEARLNEVAADLQSTMADTINHGVFLADEEDHEGRCSHFFHHQILQTARKLDYVANTRTYRGWARLVLRNADQTAIVVSFHGIGREFQGVLACSAFLFKRVETEEGEREIGPATALTNEVFLIHYNESEEAAKSRFSKWLEEAIARGIRLWHTAIP